MKAATFVADTPAAALAQIHEQFGPDAIVLSVRPWRAPGPSRFWQKNRAVEVLAYVEENPQPADSQPSSPPLSPPLSSPLSGRPFFDKGFDKGTDAGPHVFIGPPGAGKTTLLCKWLVSAVLTQHESVRLWRLDGVNANTAEVLNIYGEMFSVPVERFWSNQDRGVSSRAPQNLQLVDLPGVETDDAQGLVALKEQLALLPSPHLHLVLNAAYELPLLFQQFRAFARFEPEDLSFTHLDEEPNGEKLRRVAAGTNCSLRFLSAGQKIPGQFSLAENLPPFRQQEAVDSAFSQRSPQLTTGWQSFC